MCLGLTAFFLEENSGLRFIYSKLVFMLGTFLAAGIFARLAGEHRALPALQLRFLGPGQADRCL